jgi:hypothetical protein
VLPRRIGETVGWRTWRAEGELSAENGREAVRTGGLGEADDAVEAVVIGDREPGEPEPGGLVGQLLGMAGAVEEGEVGVAVQLGVGREPLLRSARDSAPRADDPIERMFGSARPRG